MRAAKRRPYDVIRCLCAKLEFAQKRKRQPPLPLMFYFAWLAKHCWEYGFILRYPENKKSVTGFNYEPWHFRYLGKPLAEAVYNSGLTLEEYLQSIE